MSGEAASLTLLLSANMISLLSPTETLGDAWNFVVPLDRILQPWFPWFLGAASLCYPRETVGINSWRGFGGQWTPMSTLDSSTGTKGTCYNSCITDAHVPTEGEAFQLPTYSVGLMQYLLLYKTKKLKTPIGF